MDILKKIDILFEQEFQVHHEPVKSALLQTVGQVIKDVWDLDPRYSKYCNLTDEQLVSMIGKDANELVTNAKICKTKCNTELDAAGRAPSTNIEDLKAKGVKSGHIAAMVTPDKENKTIPPSKMVDAVKEILALIMKFAANDPGISTDALIKNIKKTIKTTIPNTEINKIIAIISKGESVFADFINVASEKGPEAAAAEVNKEKL